MNHASTFNGAHMLHATRISQVAKIGFVHVQLNYPLIRLTGTSSSRKRIKHFHFLSQLLVLSENVICWNNTYFSLSKLNVPFRLPTPLSRYNYKDDISLQVNTKHYFKQQVKHKSPR